MIEIFSIESYLLFNICFKSDFGNGFFKIE